MNGFYAFYEAINLDGLVKSITDGARRKCPWGARRSGFSGTRQYM